jgi:hypothetical protein
LFIYNYCYKANPTGLLEVQLSGDLLSYWRHLLQELRILHISIVGGQSTRDYVHWSLGEVLLHVRQDLIGDGLRQMLDVRRQMTGSLS